MSNVNDHRLPKAERKALTRLRKNITETLKLSQRGPVSLEDVDDMLFDHSEAWRKVKSAYNDAVPFHVEEHFARYFRDLATLRANALRHAHEKERRQAKLPPIMLDDSLGNSYEQAEASSSSGEYSFRPRRQPEAKIEHHTNPKNPATSEPLPKEPSPVDRNISALQEQVVALTAQMSRLLAAQGQGTSASTPAPMAPPAELPAPQAAWDSRQPRRSPLDGMERFDGSQSAWPAFSRAVMENLLRNRAIPENEAKLFLLNAIGRGTAIHRILSANYAQGLPLSSLWAILVNRYSDESRVEIELVQEASKVKPISNFGDTEGLEEMVLAVTRLASSHLNMLNPAPALELRLIQMIAARCHPELQFQVITSVDNLEQLSVMMDRHWRKAVAYRLHGTPIHTGGPQTPKRTVSTHNIDDSSGSPPSFSNPSAQSTPLRSSYAETAAKTLAPALPSPVPRAQLTWTENRVEANNISPTAGRAHPSPPSFSSASSSSGSSTASPTVRRICYYCESEGHYSDDCVVPRTAEQKLETIRRMALCWNCLRPGHAADNCRIRPFTCAFCRRAHKSSTHPIWVAFQARYPQEAEASPSPTVSSNVLYISNLEDGPVIREGELKPMGIIMINDRPTVTLIDTGSDRTFLAGAVAMECERRAIEPITVKPYESPTFVVKEVALCIIRGRDGRFLSIPALVARKTGANQLIVGMDYLSSLRLPPLELPFGTFTLTQKNGEVQSIAMISLNMLEPAPELEDEASDHARMRIEFQNGRFSARLPFTSDERPPNNFEQAHHLLRASYRRMTPEMRRAYATELDQYVQGGYAQETQDVSGYIMPHFAVHREKAVSTKVRIVFDASHGRISLNNTLYRGCTPGLAILDKLFRFRKGSFAAVVDIAKAFLQIKIDPADQPYLRYLWIDDNDQLRVYQFTRLPFGLVSSPAILEQCLAHVVRALPTHSQELFYNAIYMDDAVLSTSDENRLALAISDAAPVFRRFGFELHKIVTNSSQVKKAVSCLDGATHKVLGVQWQLEDDLLRIKAPSINWGPVTKNFYLHVLGSLYDPYGLVAPVKIAPLRVLSSAPGPLDAPLPAPAIMLIKEFVEALPALNLCYVPRELKGSHLYGFADASAEAYGYCIFLCHEGKMTFVFGKSKIVPSDSKRTIPELELAALWILARRIVEVREALGSSISQITIASDSMITIDRLQMDLNKQNSFVSSRVINILKLATMHTIDVRHIKGADNPADEFSRPVGIREFVRRPNRYVRTVPPLGRSLQLQQIYALHEAPVEDRMRMIEALIAPTLTATLDRAVLTMRFTRLCQAGIAERRGDGDTFQEPTREEALRWLFQLLEDFIPRKNLHAPVHQVDGFWCLKTRARGYSPRIFPNFPPLIEALMHETHERCCHAGRDRLYGEVSNQFFVMHLKDHIATLLRQCTLCTYLRKKPIAQPLGYWPSLSLREASAFEIVALDCFGPYNLLDGTKVHGLIMVCLKTRAIQVCAIPRINIQETAMALENMFCITGQPRLVFSDNGLNLQGIARRSSEIVTAVQFLTSRRMQWSFSPPLAPWFNASAERLIGTFKNLLASLVNEYSDFQAITFVFNQVVRIVNDRTLFSVDGENITPNMLWKARRPQTFDFATNMKLFPVRVSARRRRDEARRLNDLWEKNYHQLLAIQDNDRKAIDLCKGQLVLVPEKKVHRKKWKRAVIVDVFPGPDGVTRVVDLLIAGHKQRLRRASNGLILFEGNPLFEEEMASFPPAEHIDGSSSSQGFQDEESANSSHSSSRSMDYSMESAQSDQEVSAHHVATTSTSEEDDHWLAKMMQQALDERYLEAEHTESFFLDEDAPPTCFPRQ